MQSQIMKRAGFLLNKLANVKKKCVKQLYSNKDILKNDVK